MTPGRGAFRLRRPGIFRNHHVMLRRFPTCLSLVLLGGSLIAGSQGGPIPIVQGTQIGLATFDPGDTPRGGHGQTIDGIEGSSREMLKVHVHAHLALFSKGQQIAIPYGIGIVKPFQVNNGFVGMGQGIYWLHTHDATGIVHVESPDDRTYTLGNFFNIWGQTLSRSEVAGFQGSVRAFVDGKPYSGDPRGIVLGAHTQITLEVGAPFRPPPVYQFPAGL
jgi:hypothetical protein